MSDPRSVPNYGVVQFVDTLHGDLLLAFEFFCKLWGGRFGHFFVVDPQAGDDLTRFRLGSSLPEFIYGIGLDEHWASAVRHPAWDRLALLLRVLLYVRDKDVAKPVKALGLVVFSRLRRDADLRNVPSAKRRRGQRGPLPPDNDPSR